MTDLFLTKEEIWLERWDDFLKTDSRGHFSQYSTWLKSYMEYGFDFQLLLFLENNKIIGGCGFVIPKFAIFKFVIVPAGPIVDQFNDDKIEVLLKKMNDYAVEIRACYLQINLPHYSDNKKSDFTSSKLESNSFYYTGFNGTKFKYVISVDGFRFVDLSDKFPEQKYNTNTRRNIKKAFHAGLQFHFAETPQEIKLAYECIENNAVSQGYGVRSFNAFKHTLYDLIKKKQAVFAVCSVDNKIVGALFLIEAGNRFSYISGGTDRNYSSYNIGHFLHQQMIQLSIEKEYQVYDISVGGNYGVIRFKEGFGGIHYKFIGTKYWILKPTVFKIFLFFDKYLKPHKAKIAALLSKIK